MVSANDVSQWLLAAGGVAGVTGGIVATVQSRATRRRLNAEADKLTSEAEKLTSEAEMALTQRASAVNAMALGLLVPMEDRIKELTADVAYLKAQINALTDRLELAQRLLTEHGIPLPPTTEPPGWRDVRDRDRTEP